MGYLDERKEYSMPQVPVQYPVKVCSYKEESSHINSKESTELQINCNNPDLEADICQS